MPIIVPVLRRIAQSISSVWQTVNHYYYVFTHNQYNIERDTTKEIGSTEEAQASLPDIPRVAFFGLRTFISKYQRSNAAATELQSSGSANVLMTQDSAGPDYHSQLKNMYSYDPERNASSNVGDS